MVEHLSRERIAALLDGPDAFGPDREHLEDCEACTHEYEQMLRVRMALSAMPELEPPADEWEGIHQRLGLDVASIGRRFSVPALFTARPVWAAAVVALFAAGLGVGHQMADSGNEPGVRTAVLESPSVAATTPGSADATDAYLRTVAEIERLRGEGAPDPAAWSDPSAATERLMKLDALIEASREALRTAPTDPALNDFLFDVVDERDSLAGRLNRSLRYTSVEY
ncbi:MAG: hypothetical protein M8867_06365 [marine benthic group bacterium]|nr:hypothetical protein [Gemmatimonadota bacterium]